MRLASRSYRYLARRLSRDHARPAGEAPGRGALVVLSGACRTDVVVENAMMLAAALAAEVKARVLLVDGDLRDGMLTARFGLAGVGGLVDLMQEDRDLAPLVHATARDGVSVLPLGGGGHLLPGAHNRLAEVMAALRARFDFILLVQGEASSDTRYLAFACDADTVLLLAEEGTTRIAQIEEAEALFTIHDVDHVKLLLSETAGNGAPALR